jgi:hypothetical protein
MKSLTFLTLLLIAAMCNATKNKLPHSKKHSPSISLWKKELKTDGKFLLGSALVANPFPISLGIVKYLSQNKCRTWTKALILPLSGIATACMMAQGYQYLHDAHNELIELDRLLEDNEHKPTASKIYRYVGNATITGGAFALLLGYSSLLTAADDYIFMRSNFFDSTEHKIITGMLLLTGPLLVRLGYKIKSWCKPETAAVTETESNHYDNAS